MIRSLLIKNIALIEDLTLEFRKGLNVLTGETGAGKSIMIDSLTFVLGDRADKSLIRHGQNQAAVEVVFDRPENAEFHALMEEFGLPDEEDVIVRRTMNASGRSDCRINGFAVNLNTLRKLVTLLVDVHTQHESTYLLQEANHQKIYDRYVGNLADKIAQYQLAWREYHAIAREIESYSDAESRSRRMDVLRYQISEIDRVAVEDGEEERLKAERAKLQNFQRIQTGLNTALTLLAGEESFAVGDSLNRAMREIRALERYVSAYSDWSERLDSLQIELSDITESIRAELEGGGFDAARAEQVEKRLEDIRAVLRKYGRTVQDVAKFRADAEAELQKLERAQEHLDELQTRLTHVRKIMLEVAARVHAMRMDAREAFSQKILANLRELGMPSATFEVSITAPETEEERLRAVGETGFDTILFRFSANKGEPLRPLAKIASGGEMSRFMLGLKTITAEYEGIGTLVFDEIDTGISGKIAHVVASKLFQISLAHQVIAVTHLTQLAAMADANWHISKHEGETSTHTEVELLDAQQRIAELMRLSGSAEDSRAGEQNAIELLAHAEDVKNQIKYSNK